MACSLTLMLAVCYPINCALPSIWVLVTAIACSGLWRSQKCLLCLKMAQCLCPPNAKAESHILKQPFPSSGGKEFWD